MKASGEFGALCLFGGIWLIRKFCRFLYDCVFQDPAYGKASCVLACLSYETDPWERLRMANELYHTLKERWGERKDVQRALRPLGEMLDMKNHGCTMGLNDANCTYLRGSVLRELKKYKYQ